MFDVIDSSANEKSKKMNRRRLFNLFVAELYLPVLIYWRAEGAIREKGDVRTIYSPVRSLGIVYEISIPARIRLINLNIQSSLRN